MKRGTLKLDAAAGEPSFRRYGIGDSFRYPQPKPEHIDVASGRVFLPKLGWVRYRNSRKPEGVIRQITVSLDAGRWMIALTMETKKSAGSRPCAGEIIAADHGVTDTLALSTGQRIAPLNAYRTSRFKLRRYQRSVSRKTEAQKKSMGLDPKAPFPKGVHPPKSNRQHRAELKMAKCHRKIANQRRDWAHKLTTLLADLSGIVVLEDLKTKNMTANAKGDAETPGRNVRQKAGLNTSILDQGWYLIEQLLGYKVAWRGGELLKVSAAYTSQRCACCGHIDAVNRKGKRFRCTACGHANDADINAAQNILAAGLAVLASRKQNILTARADVEDVVKPCRPAKRQPASTGNHHGSL